MSAFLLSNITFSIKTQERNATVYILETKTKKTKKTKKTQKTAGRHRSGPLCAYYPREKTVKKERCALSLQAIIMAGGEGVRLRPLTMHTPKPLAPLLGKPVMGYAIELLKAHGIKNIGVTLWYRPRMISRAFGKGEGWGVQLKYFEETEPLGTAGSVKMAKDDIREPFFVLSGDGLTDCDLTDALAFHRKKKALATLVLKRVSMPLPYGVVLTDREGRITRFIEKPDWSRVLSDLVNTGIYILEPEILDAVPAGGRPDFGKDIFPALLERGLPVYGYETGGYWCDVGDQRAYLEAQRDLLEGRVRLPCPRGVDAEARVDPTARLEGPCLVGAGARIGPGAQIRGAVIGNGCVIGAGAVVENACLWAGAQVHEKARVRGSVLCDGAAVRRGAEVGDGCALGKQASVGPWAQLQPGVKVWPYLKIPPNAIVVRSVTEGAYGAPQWTEKGADCPSAESVCALCGAYAGVTGIQRVVTGWGDAAASLEALAAGALSAAGIRVMAGGEMTEPMLRALVRAFKADGGVFAAGQSIRFFGKGGLPLSSGQRSAMDARVLRQETPAILPGGGAVVPLKGAEEMYLAAVMPPGEGGGPLLSPLAVFSDSRRMRRLAQEALRRLQARDMRFGTVAEALLRPGETGLVLSDSGEEVTVFTGDRALTRAQNTMLLLSLCLKKTGVLYDLPGVPRAAEKMAPLLPPDEKEACALQRTVLQDGLAAMALVCQALGRHALEALLEGIPETHIVSRNAPCDMREKGRILHALCGQITLPYTMGEGIRVQHGDGSAAIVPDSHRDLVRVVSEASSGEFARELCDFYWNRIQEIRKTKNT